jgi:hypothetical protein
MAQICGRCAAENPDNELSCKKCGLDLVISEVEAEVVAPVMEATEEKLTNPAAAPRRSWAVTTLLVLTTLLLVTVVGSALLQALSLKTLGVLIGLAILSVLTRLAYKRWRAAAEGSEGVEQTIVEPSTPNFRRRVAAMLLRHLRNMLQLRAWVSATGAEAEVRRLENRAYTPPPSFSEQFLLWTHGFFLATEKAAHHIKESAKRWWASREPLRTAKRLQREERMQNRALEMLEGRTPWWHLTIGQWIILLLALASVLLGAWYDRFLLGLAACAFEVLLLVFSIWRKQKGESGKEAGDDTQADHEAETMMQQANRRARLASTIFLGGASLLGLIFDATFAGRMTWTIAPLVIWALWSRGFFFRIVLIIWGGMWVVVLTTHLVKGGDTP